MKFSAAVVVAAAVSATEKKVPSRHPVQRLNRLVEFTEEILTDWFDFLPSQQAWINKFATNAGRMERNFERGNQRCGFYDETQLPHGGPRERRDVDEIRYDRENPKVGVKQLTTGFRKWAERYISQCSGQKNFQFQVKRMAKWNNALQKHLEVKEKEDKCGDRAIFHQGGIGAPAFLSVAQWNDCVDRKNNPPGWSGPSWAAWCKPADKPDDCPATSWEQLFGECVVREIVFDC